MRDYLREFFLELCCSYAIISVVGAIINIILGSETNNFNVLCMFAFCAIAVFVLSLHKLLASLSPLLMILIQYVVALALCMLVVFIISLVDSVSPRGWFEFFRSFTIVYVFGAGYYYYRVFRDTRKQAEMLKEIQEAKEEF